MGKKWFSILYEPSQNCRSFHPLLNRVSTVTAVTLVGEICAVPNFHPEIGKYKWVLRFSGRFPAEKA